MIFGRHNLSKIQNQQIFHFTKLDSNGFLWHKKNITSKRWNQEIFSASNKIRVQHKLLHTPTWVSDLCNRNEMFVNLPSIVSFPPYRIPEKPQAIKNSWITTFWLSKEVHLNFQNDPRNPKVFFWQNSTR